MTTDPLQVYRQRARKRPFGATPSNLGWEVGIAGADIPSPYEVGSKADACYLRGKANGRVRWLSQLSKEPNQ